MRNPLKQSSIASTSNSKKSTTPCCSKVGIKRGPWTPEEDDILANYIKKEGEGRWRTLPNRAGLLRCGKSCRLRWMNYLRPSVKRGPIAPDEEDLILRLHRLLGNRWSLIAGRIPGRTDNEIKNYWNTHLSKKLISQGIDPRNHKPLNPINPVTKPIPHDSFPIQTRIPIPFQLEEQAYRSIHSTKVSENYAMAHTNQQHHYYNQNLQVVDHGTQNWPTNYDGFEMGLQSNGGQGQINEEDTFSSFLDSLINENVFGNYQQQENRNIEASMNPNVVSSSNSLQASSYNRNSWEAEILAALSHDLGDGANLDSHQP